MSSLPAFCIPPQTATWITFEMEARGSIPRSDGESLESAGKKRKRAANDMDSRLKIQPNTSARRYKDLEGYGPTLRRFLDQLIPQPFYPPTVPFWEESSKTASVSATRFLSDTGSYASFYPSPSLFLGVDKRLTLASMLVRVIDLWPTLHDRIVLARTDPSVRRLGSQDWRDILRGFHFKKDVGRAKNEPVDFKSVDNMYLRYGSELVFGRARTADVKAGKKDAIAIGTMSCGHRATVEDLDDDAAIRNVLFVLTQMSVLHELAALAPQQWAKLPTVVDKFGSYRAPAFHSPSDRLDPAISAAMGMIEKIAHPVPTPLSLFGGWCAGTRQSRMPWLLAVREYFKKVVPGVDELFKDQPDTNEPWNKPWRRIKDVPEGRLSKSDAARLEKLLLEAWWACSFKAGILPSSLLAPPMPGLAPPNPVNNWPACKACRVQAAARDPYDTDDEDSFSD